MGMFQVKVRVENPREAGRAFEEKFWVDTGALYSFVPAPLLEKIGVTPTLSREFVLADGRHEKLPVGEAILNIEGSSERITCLVAFAPPSSLMLLGATALENFGVDADPVNRTLKPVTAVIGGHLTSH